MPTTNEQLAAALLSHAVGINRLSSAEVRRLLVILRRTERLALKELERRLLRAGDLAYDTGPYTTLRLRRILADVRAVLHEGYAAIHGDLGARLGELSRYEVDYLARAYGRVIPEDIFTARPELGVGRPSADLLASLVRNPVVNAHPLGHYFRKDGPESLIAKQVQRYRKVIRETVEEGLLVGETVEQQVRRVVSRVRRFATPAGRVHLRTLVDSAVKSTMQRSRSEFIRANSGPDGVVKAIVWDSTFDSRTTLEWCVPRHGQRYHPETHEPLNGGPPWSTRWGSGPGAIHPRCRSGQITELKSWRELGIRAKELKGATRASMRGPIPRGTGMEAFYRSLPEEDLARHWGKTRAGLFKDGKVSLAGMVRSDGRLYRLRDLRGVDEADLAAALSG